MEWQELRGEIVAVTARVADLLRGMPAGDLPLARVEWSAAETGAHLVSLARRYRVMVRRMRRLPSSLAEDNQRALAEVPERDPRVLADLLTTEVDVLLDVLGPDGDRPTFYFACPHTSAGLGAIMLTELLVHGLDLARATGTPWPISRDQAAACVHGLVPAVIQFADAAKARAATGTYHLHVRGSHDWTIRIHGDGTAVERGRPLRADLHFSVEPVAFLLTSFGHLGRTRAALTGKLVAWGRKPWLAPRFVATFRET